MDNIESRLSLRELIGDVAEDARDLIRGEIALARAEAERKMDRAIAGVVMVIGAALLAFAGLVIVLIAAAQALARVMPDWAASLIVGGVVLVIGLVLVELARRALSPSSLVPHRTIENVQADATVVRESAT
jgi:hypothetical protein